jgi:hypothetical protein
MTFYYEGYLAGLRDGLNGRKYASYEPCVWLWHSGYLEGYRIGLGNRRAAHEGEGYSIFDLVLDALRSGSN